MSDICLVAERQAATFIIDQRFHSCMKSYHCKAQVVGFRGTKNVSYQEALAAIFIEGWIFIAISIVGVRQKLIALLPRSARSTRLASRLQASAALMHHAPEGIETSHAAYGGCAPPC